MTRNPRSGLAGRKVDETILPRTTNPVQGVNVERDQQAARDIVRKTGQTGVPVIKIGSRWIVGFDKERIEKELARRVS